MALTLIAVVLALVFGRLAPGLIALRRYGWFIAWLQWLGRVFGGQSVWQGRFGLLIGVGLPVALVGAGQWLLDDRAYGLPAFGFALLALLYTWGPRDLDLDVDTVIEATDPEARRAAAASLFPEGGEPVIEGPALVEAVFRCALWRWFGVLFWFLVLGASGAILYRLVSLSAQGEAQRTLPPAQNQAARLFIAILNWPVAHLMSFGLALAANFDGVLGRLARLARQRRPAPGHRLPWRRRAGQRGLRTDRGRRLCHRRTGAGAGPARAARRDEPGLARAVAVAGGDRDLRRGWFRQLTAYTPGSVIHRPGSSP